LQRIIFEEEKFIKQKTNYKKWIVQIVIIAIALTAAFFLFNHETEVNFMRSSEIEFIVSQDDRAAVVEVPDFLNSTLTQADIWSRNNEVNYTYSYEYSSIYERDRIMSQSVAAGDDMNTNDIISFVL
jgi:hypothetical protein